MIMTYWSVVSGRAATVLKPLQPNCNEGLYVRTYNSLVVGTNKINRDEDNFITREDYKGGYALYAFDLAADLAVNRPLQSDETQKRATVAEICGIDATHCQRDRLCGD